MKEAVKKYEEIVYVCVNQKDGKECCGARGSEEIKDELKSESKKRFGDLVKVVATKCQGHCKEGPVVTFASDNKKYVGVAPSDIRALIERISHNITLS